MYRAVWALPLAVRPRTARYIPIQQLTGTRTGRYRAVPLKSTVGDRFWLSAVDFNRRQLIDGEIDCRQSIEEEKGKRRKKKKYLARGPRLCAARTP
ncbi:hypothetical protein GW17_00002214 [Ensete ventricosum]|nr:hypothetical protein GW17_00002214 [Ensete ventricosum]